MTREEQRYLKECKEKQFIEFIKGKKIDGKQKAEFRTTKFWTEFRKRLFNERKVDYLTHRKLQKKYNLHHMRFDSSIYTELDEKFFRCYNSNSHDVLHWCVSETIKDSTFMQRLTEEVNLHIEINNGKDVKDFLK